ncbi:MAG: GNAT family N-acetyltransferase [Rhodobacteraceae bacterium]|nr:GNAT family N-acetyltransferase [Paracoccaceae bacterium]
MMPPVLKTDRLILRPHRVEDWHDVAAMWADPEVVRHVTGTPSSAPESWGRLLRYIGHWQALGFGYWVVEARDDGRFLGEVGFADYRRDITPSLGGVPEAGWVFAQAAHGQGFASEAVQRMHQWADQVKGWRETVCIFDPEHMVSQHVARKTGYQISGEALCMGQPTLVMRRVSSVG